MPTQMRYKENCVYALDLGDGKYKIGMTSRLGDRMSASQRKHGVQCYPVLLIKGMDRKTALKVESDIHWFLSEWRANEDIFMTSIDRISEAFDAFGGLE